MNKDERRACDVVGAAIVEEGARSSVPLTIGGDAEGTIPCKVDVSIGQPADMQTVKVRMLRRPLPTETGVFPDHRSVSITNGHLGCEGRSEVRDFVRDISRICRRGAMLTAAGIAHDDAPLWTYDIDEITLRVMSYGSGGTFDIQRHRTAVGMPLIQYMPRAWTAPTDRPVLYGVGERLQMPEGTWMLYDEDEKATISINENKRRVGVMGLDMPETVRQWISVERPSVARVIGHPAFEGCGVRIDGVNVEGGWITFDYERCIVPAAAPPNREAVAWREI